MCNKHIQSFSYINQRTSVTKLKGIKRLRFALLFLINVFLALNCLHVHSASAASASEIDIKVNTALNSLYDTAPGTRSLGKDAEAILVFPEIVKAGFIVGGQFGEGALLKNGNTVAYYSSLAASYGLQAGIQSFGYVLFFMDQASLQYLEKSKGWEIGTGPSIVVLDEGFAKKLSSTTLQKGVYAFIFGQKGLMAGIGLEGSKIKRIHPDN